MDKDKSIQAVQEGLYTLAALGITGAITFLTDWIDRIGVQTDQTIVWFLVASGVKALQWFVTGKKVPR